MYLLCGRSETVKHLQNGFRDVFHECLGNGHVNYPPPPKNTKCLNVNINRGWSFFLCVKEPTDVQMKFCILVKCLYFLK